MTHTDAFAAFQAKRDEQRAQQQAKPRQGKQRTKSNATPGNTRTRLSAPDEATLNAAQQRARAARESMEDVRRRFSVGAADYDELAAAGKACSEALYAYAKLKSPAHARRIPYQDLIR